MQIYEDSVTKKSLSRLDVRNDDHLLNNLAFSPHSNEEYSQGLLITGPNSFIGIHTIKELQSLWPGDIFCLIRAGSDDEAHERMRSVINAWRIEGIDLKRIVLVPGEITKQNWGLDQKTYNLLQEKTGFILHLALAARYDYPYLFYRETWLPELYRMIEYCGNERHPKKLHYPGSYNCHFMTEDSDFQRQDTTAWHSGYAGFKWLVDRILRRAYGSNLGGCLYDIPLVFGSNDVCLCPDQYSSWQIIKLFIETGIVINLEFRAVTVDVLAKTIAHNIFLDLSGKGASYLRPVLPDGISHDHVMEIIGEEFHLKTGTWDDFIARSHNPKKASFMMPKDFTSLIDKAHKLPPIYPLGLDTSFFPNAVEAFRNNVEAWLRRRQDLNSSRKKEGSLIARDKEKTELIL